MSTPAESNQTADEAAGVGSDAAAETGTNIRYVCLSDLHFGAENSILTNLLVKEVRADVQNISPTLIALVDCLGELISHNKGGVKPTLILNGDILELALAEDNVAAMVFTQFVKLTLVRDDPLFANTIFYVPGNHDHHLWEGARERQYADYVKKQRADQDLDRPWHTTWMFAGHDPISVHSELLEALIERAGVKGDIQVRTVYPNLALGDGDRCVVVHHGHYLESIYRLMTELKSFAFPSPEWDQPQEIWQIEAENFAWIDFFWSTLGRSGDVGADVGLVYASFQSQAAMRRLADRIATGIGKRIHSWIPLRWVEQLVVRIALRRLAMRVGKLERSQPTETLTAPAKAELLSYIEGPVRLQMERECRHLQRDLPKKLTFVFGHTHKPFEAQLETRSFGQVNVLNTGGWVVDTLVRAPLQGGAAVLISEDLDAVSLRLYQQMERGQPSTVELRAAEEGEGSFLSRLRKLVHPDQAPWRDMSERAAKVVSQRYDDLRKILEAAPDGGA